MLDFLPDEKRKVLLKYPFVRDFLLGKINKNVFLRNLEAFKSELLSQKITEADLEQVKERGQEMSEDEYNKIINSLSEEERRIALRLRVKEAPFRWNAVTMLTGCKKCIPLIEHMLKDENSTCRNFAILVLRKLNSKKSIPLIEHMLEDKVPIVRSQAVAALAQLGSKKSTAKIKKRITDPDPHVRLETIIASYFLGFKLDNELIEEAMKGVPWMTEEQARILFKITGDIKYHRLYFELGPDFIEEGKEGLLSVKRRKFRKSGSETILLGGRLVGKAIIRIISERAFLAWKRAFEAEDAWKKAGFDYIPVEPILKKGNKLRAYKGKNGRWRVSTKVLGESLLHLKGGKRENLKIPPEVDKMMDKIVDVLKQLEIFHGHLHLGNFCVENYKGKPRLYVIDFDQAISPGP